ncbi:MAG TPA: response regulator, partial [Planctomycetes bacterium]|nr:response regulator [Planctomycetota bacterium]
MSAVKLRKMLIVEDEPDLLATLARAASVTAGVMALEAPTISDARRIIETHADLRLAVTDVRLPDGNGLDLIREVRSNGCLLPFIVITGYHQADVAVDAYRLGAIRYLMKPFDLDSFLSAVDETLSWSHLVYGFGETFALPMQGWVEITSPA